jgi:glucose-6-phosphate isomerase
MGRRARAVTQRGSFAPTRIVGVSDTPPLSAHVPPPLKRPLEAKLAQARDERVAERVRGGDATLWAPAGTPEVANRLGWLTIAERMRAQAGELRAFAEEARAEGISDVVLLGMGGSSLAAETMRRSFGPQSGWPALHVLDSTDAATVLAERTDPATTLYVVSSKSGGTIEPLSMWAHFWALAPAGRRNIAITDPGSGLEELAHAHAFRHVFAGDPDIGGRYSALSAFGIVPAALAGYDIEGLLKEEGAAWKAALAGREVGNDREAGVSSEGAHGAGSAKHGSGAEDPAWLWIGAALSAWAQEGRDKLTILAEAPLQSVGLWLEQLVAESTGKRGTGILPVAEEPLGEPGEYGEDRVFLYLPDHAHPDEARAQKVRALEQAGHPVITLPTAGPTDLGRVFMLAELAVAVAGWGLGINPYDQPNVQQAKDATKHVLEQYERSGALPNSEDAEDTALAKLLGEAKPPEYVAIMGYVQPSEEFDAAVAELRTSIRAATRATTTYGYGPRYLHSTGQFHKGGPPVGRFLQLLHDGPQDAEIPGVPYNFTTLKNAQATGDLETLRELKRPAERVRLHGDDPASALRTLTAKIKELL